MDNIETGLNFAKDTLAIAIKATGTTLVKRLIENKIRPIIDNFFMSKNDTDKMERTLAEYFQKSYNSNVYINTIVFKNTPKLLEELYIPLTIVHPIPSKVEKYKILDDSENDLFLIFESCLKLMIVDTAGMGKSTLLKYIMLKALERGAPIPINIELRRLDPETDIIDFITREINLLDGVIKKEQVTKLLKEGEFLILLDGYDEIREIDKTKIALKIQEFIKITPDTKYILTSREEVSLSSFYGFKIFNIEPLALQDAFSLIKKYDNNNLVSKNLIEMLKNDVHFDSLRELLTNPLLISLLYKTFQYREEIPYKKLIFYETAFEALFNDHDYTKGGAYVHEKKTELDICDFRKLARELGWATFKLDKNEISIDELTNILIKISNKCFDYHLKASMVIDDLLHSVPLFCKDGNNFRWVHKSFMEYFVACYIHNDLNTEQKKLILKSKLVLNNNSIRKYVNILDFYYDLDNASFRKFIVLPFLLEFSNKYVQVFSDSYFNMMDKVYLQCRKSMLVLLNIEIERKKDELTFLESYKYPYRGRAETEFLNKEEKRYSGKTWTTWASESGGNCIEGFIKETSIVGGPLLRIMQNKRIDIFIFKNSIYPCYIGIRPECFIQKNRMLRIDDDINSEINKNSDIFSYITAYLIISHGKTTGYNFFLDIDKVGSFIERINEEVENEELDVLDF
nr:NACHT domain-containing protein [uncultured Acetobacterium sp.]